MSQDENNASKIQDDDQLDQSYMEGKNNDRFENNASSGSTPQKQHDSSTDETNESGEDLDQINQTAAAKHVANDTNIKQASTSRDPNRQPARANEATDRNDSGSGGISAGGVKSGSSLQ